MMMGVTKVSVIMATGGSRLDCLRRTLESWSKITYPVQFILVSTDVGNDKLRDLALSFKFVSKFVEPRHAVGKDWARVSNIWTREGRESSGDYVIFAMADEILGDYDIIQKFLACPTPNRSSVRTYFLNGSHASKLDGMDWLSNPKDIENLPEFWTHKEVQGAEENNDNLLRKLKQKVYLLSHITGAPRAHWEYMNWFRTDEYGYFWLDRDVHFREITLGFECKEVVGVCCYHQWHPLLLISKVDREYGGYIYENDAQARLLEPARRENENEALV